jgi:hypothetical protein
VTVRSPAGRVYRDWPLQNTALCAVMTGREFTPGAAQSGSAAVIKKLFAPLAIPTTAEQTCAKPVSFSLSHKGRRDLLDSHI